MLKSKIKGLRSSKIDNPSGYLTSGLIAELGILPIALDFIKFYENEGFSINKIELQETLEFLIAEHAPMGHTSEVSYGIFGMIPKRDQKSVNNSKEYATACSLIEF